MNILNISHVRIFLYVHLLFLKDVKIRTLVQALF